MTRMEVKLSMLNGSIRELYKKELIKLIRLRYDVNDETDILFDPVPEKVMAHNEYVEACKREVKERIRLYGGSVE